MMGVVVDLMTTVPRTPLVRLIARSEINIRRSRALIAAAEAVVRAGRRMRRPRFAGGADGADVPAAGLGDPRVLRTWSKMKEGSLATDGARRRWVGPGHGEHCSGCGEIIPARDIEFEVDFRNALLLRFHRECFKTWETFDGNGR
jgi:hypothetical protein